MHTARYCRFLYHCDSAYLLASAYTFVIINCSIELVKTKLYQLN